MSFDNDKKVILEKKDKSKKGSVDSHIRELIDYINQKEDLYTTSSCSGRITLMTAPPPGKKYEAVWLYVSHDRVDKKKLKKALIDLPDAQVWLKMESFILHLRARTLEAATTLQAIAKQAGFKHTGIISLKSKIILEIFGADRLDVPIADDQHLLVDESYIDYLTTIADQKLDANHERISLFFNLLRKESD